MDKGRMTPALKIWLNPDMVDTKKDAAPRPRGYVSVYDRKIAQFSARNLRRELLMKQRRSSNAVKGPVLRLLRHRDHRSVSYGQGGKGANSENVAVVEDVASKEARRVRDIRVKHLLALRVGA
jgi:hypothetical protein